MVAMRGEGWVGFYKPTFKRENGVLKKFLLKGSLSLLCIVILTSPISSNLTLYPFPRGKGRVGLANLRMAK
jgi:hypothetical protein